MRTDELSVGVWYVLGRGSGEPSPEHWDANHISALEEIGPFLNLIICPARNTSGVTEVMDWCLSNRKISVWSDGLDLEIHEIQSQPVSETEIRKLVRNAWRKLSPWHSKISGVVLNLEDYDGSGTPSNPDFRQLYWTGREFERLYPKLALAVEGQRWNYPETNPRSYEEPYDVVFKFPRGVWGHCRYSFYGWGQPGYYDWKLTWGQVGAFRQAADIVRYRGGAWVNLAQAFETHHLGLNYQYPTQEWQDFICLNAIAHGATGINFWPFDTGDSSDYCGLLSSYNSSGATNQRVIVRNSIEKAWRLFDQLKGFRLIDYSLNNAYDEVMYEVTEESAIPLNWPIEKIDSGVTSGDWNQCWDLIEICHWILRAGFEKYTLSNLDPRAGQVKTLQISLKESCEWSIGSQSGYGKTISDVTIQPGQVEVLTLRRW